MQRSLAPTNYPYRTLISGLVFVVMWMNLSLCWAKPPLYEYRSEGSNSPAIGKTVSEACSLGWKVVDAERSNLALQYPAEYGYVPSVNLGSDYEISGVGDGVCFLKDGTTNIQSLDFPSINFVNTHGTASPVCSDGAGGYIVAAQGSTMSTTFNKQVLPQPQYPKNIYLTKDGPFAIINNKESYCLNYAQEFNTNNWGGGDTLTYLDYQDQPPINPSVSSALSTLFTCNMTRTQFNAFYGTTTQLPFQYNVKKYGNYGLCPQGYKISYKSVPGQLQTVSCVPATPLCDTLPNELSTEKTFGKPDIKSCTGNPIHSGTGNKYQEEQDYQSGASGVGIAALSFVRHYNSMGSDRDPSLSVTTRFGNAWGVFPLVASYGYPAYSTAYVRYPDQHTVYFNGGYTINGNTRLFKAQADITDRLLVNLDASQVATGWTLTHPNGDIDTFDVEGILSAHTNSAGLGYSVSWNWGANAAVITDSFGRTIQLQFDSAGKGNLLTMTDPANQVYRYGYDANNNLSTVTYPDNTVRSYAYNESAYTSGSNLPGMLTGIVDENLQRFATWKYDSAGKAFSSYHGGDSLGAEKVTLSFTLDGNGNPANTSITDALGAVRTTHNQIIQGVVKVNGQDQPAGAGCLAASKTTTYDANGNTATELGFNNDRSGYTYDLNRNLETSHTEGLASDGTVKPETRTVVTLWHASLALPVEMQVYAGNPTLVFDTTAGQITAVSTTAIPLYKTTYNYDNNGNLTRLEEIDPVHNKRRATNINYTYSSTLPGLVLTRVIDGPRTDIADLTTTTYYPETDPCLGCRGQVKTVVDALSHLTQFTSYDANSRLLTMTDANGTLSSLTYTPRGWLKTKTVDGKTTTLGYDNAGQLTSILLPDNSSITYTYDPAHRLTDITDALNRSVHYTLDAAGNRTKEAYINADTSLTRELNRSFDLLGRLQKAYNGPTSKTPANYGYYAGGELKTTQTPNSYTTSLDIDALGRPIKRTDPVNGAAYPSQMTYDGLDQLSSYTTPNGTTVNLTTDGLGNLTQETNPDSGNSVSTYDAAGNLLTYQDAKGLITGYHYDALNRITRMDQPASGSIPVATTLYTWDTVSGCTHGIGHVCQITDASGNTVFDYDAQGNTVSTTRTQGGFSFVSHFAYNEANRPLDVITPSSESVSVTRDMAGQIQSISSTGSNAVTSNIAQNLTYSATGQLLSGSLGLSLLNMHFDTSGQLDAVTGTDNTPVSTSTDAPLPAWALWIMGAGLMGLVHGKQKTGTGHSLWSVVSGYLLLGLISGMLSLNASQTAYADDLTLHYDDAGNVLSRISPIGTTTYTYDGLDRVKTESGATGNRTHTYDGNDNRLSNAASSTSTVTISPNTDRLATINGVAVTIDADGNLTSDGSYRYVWDALNQLRELRKMDNTLIATYDYDYRGLRTRKITTSAAPQGVTDTFYHYDISGHLLAETSGYTPLMTYLWNDGRLMGIVVHQPSRIAYTVEPDQLGSPFQIRNLQGRVVWRWESDAYGNTLPNEDTDGDGSKLKLNLRFPGQYYDQESGLHYNWHRYYSPKLARYISADLIGLAGGANQFAYVNGMPTRAIDPTGNNLLLLLPLLGLADEIMSLESVADGMPRVGGAVSDVSRGCKVAAKRGPKVDPNAPHNAKIRAVGDRIEAEGGSVIAGGGRLPERLIATPGGEKAGRRPDILYRDANGDVGAINVGRAKADSSPVSREQKALNDLNGAGIPTKFEKYN